MQKVIRRPRRTWLPITRSWEPLRDLPALVALYDWNVTSSVTLSSGQVSQVNDLSGNGYHMTQSDPTNYGFFYPTTLLGNKVAETALGVERVANLTIQTVRPWTMFVVLQWGATNASGGYVFGTDGNDGIFTNGTNDIRFRTVNLNIQSTQWVANQACCMIAICDGANTNFRVDGVDHIGNPGLQGTFTQLCWGNPQGNGTSCADMKPAFGALTYENPSAGTVASFEAYAKNRWGSP